ncbi:Uncharacterized conserved protein YbjT, contains NAD(P)-binding and DUF2867 domains [Mesorhizobium albiziae]|uniref:Uncharacterized conserved protein YbjT, contains NAD(P)-binding and DUF2867 domains n=1 Tax=Neomesorhizobium albiziae TaxID=335020 RepID=A0A1I4BSC7_9HYPH|nr:NAD(P)H-binding protein [Mesorhizobium albiziae]GLS29683.1 epimerase [Mesorhizobium albiziae]SFK71625.1 Uncharacterized conserved protein YbjT, contains NAD(P)-binding and DUF2867 domains [Mesorhizobium albiziae]
MENSVGSVAIRPGFVVDVRLLALKPGTSKTVEWAQGDLATGKGLVDAVRGVDTVLHAATLSPIAKRGMRPIDFFSSPSTVDVDGTRQLLEASSGAGIKHFLFVSIVGLESTSLPYARVKLAGEQLVKQSQLPWSVVRATPYYYLTAQMLGGLRWLPIWPLPAAPTNPVDTTDVAHYLAECLDDGKRGIRAEIGGPETMSFAEFGRQFKRAKGFHRLVASIPVSEKAGLAMGFVKTDDRKGVKTWNAWLSEQQSAPR